MNPSIKRDPLTASEEKAIYESYGQHEGVWKLISQDFPTRTDNQLKNYYYSTLRRQIRKIRKVTGKKIDMGAQELTVESIYGLVKKFHLGYTVLDSVPLIEIFKKMDAKMETESNSQEKAQKNRKAAGY